MLGPDKDGSPALVSAWSPLRHAAFRLLWGAWMTANVCMWMNEVAAGWLMTSLSPEPLMVALVQAASTLPVFLLGVPCGALADIFDRRRLFIATQVWVAAVAALLCVAAFTTTLGPSLLLVLMFANGVGLAMRWPVFAATIPELVPRAELPAALALNGVAMNASRVFGPVIAGVLIVVAGTAWVFLLNAVLSIVLAVVLTRWRHEPKLRALPAERLFGAIRVGLQHVRQSPRLLIILLRVAIFFFQAMGLLALLPLVARGIEGGGPGTFTLLLAALGSGALVAAMILPRLRTVMTCDGLVGAGTVVHALATTLVAFLPDPVISAPALVVAGCAWIVVANSLTVSAQMALPDWVRARGMAVYQMALMGGGTLGAVVWGQVASVSAVHVSLVASSVAGIVLLLVTRRFKLGTRAEEDLTPVGLWKAPDLAIPVAPNQGPVLVMVEYRVASERFVEFSRLMSASRRIWLRNGVLSWELLRDVGDPERYFEYLIDESWVDYLRRNERISVSYIALREQKRAFQPGRQTPVVTRCIAVPLPGR